MSEIVSIEIGNITTSVATKDKSYTFESRVAIANDDNKVDESIELFTVDNITYMPEMGDFENNTYKYEKKNFLNLLRFALAKVVKSGNVKLITSIPANQYNAFKDEMKNVIMNNNQIKILIGEEDKNITIEEVGVLPEGYSIYKTTPKEFLTSGAKTLIIDIGGGTTELIFMDENGKFLRGDSISTGLLRLFDLIQLDMQSETKQLLKIEDIRKFVDGKYNPRGLEKYTIDKVASKFSKELINLINGKVSDIQQQNIVIVGGGASILQKDFKEEFSHALFNTDVKSLCKSNLEVALAKWDKQ